jgi:serine/threonine protein kinase
MEKKELRKKKSLKEKVFISGKNFIGLEKLGKGTYGSVYKAQKRDTNEIFAIKKIKLDVDTEGIPSTALREISILKSLNHPNVVRIIDLTLSEKKIELCLEYCPLDLRKFMDQHKSNPKFYNLNTIKTILYQILRATDHLHSRKILHRDLKPQNILICDQTLITKIADFGLSRVYSIPIRPYTKEVLTMWYRAPELMLGLNQYSIGLDMWSVGCIFGELLIKMPLFAGDSEFDQLMKIFRVLGTPNEHSLPGCNRFPDYNSDFPLWAPIGIDKVIKERIEIKMDEESLCGALDLLKKMLVMDPCRRISAKEALSHVKSIFLFKLFNFSLFLTMSYYR